MMQRRGVSLIAAAPSEADRSASDNRAGDPAKKRRIAGEEQVGFV